MRAGFLQMRPRFGDVTANVTAIEQTPRRGATPVVLPEPHDGLPLRLTRRAGSTRGAGRRSHRPAPGGPGAPPAPHPVLGLRRARRAARLQRRPDRHAGRPALRLSQGASLRSREALLRRAAGRIHELHGRHARRHDDLLRLGLPGGVPGAGAGRRAPGPAPVESRAAVLPAGHDDPLHREPHLRHHLQPGRARDTRRPQLAVHRRQPGRGPRGEVLCRASATREELQLVRFDPAAAADKHMTPHNDLFADRRPELYRALVARRRPQ